MIIMIDYVQALHERNQDFRSYVCVYVPLSWEWESWERERAEAENWLLFECQIIIEVSHVISSWKFKFQGSNWSVVEVTSRLTPGCSKACLFRRFCLFNSWFCVVPPGSSSDGSYADGGGRQIGMISDNHLLNLCTLAYSDNVDLQRSAALCFSEFSEKCELGLLCNNIS